MFILNFRGTLKDYKIFGNFIVRRKNILKNNIFFILYIFVHTFRLLFYIFFSMSFFT